MYMQVLNQKVMCRILAFLKHLGVDVLGGET